MFQRREFVCKSSALLMTAALPGVACPQRILAADPLDQRPLLTPAADRSIRDGLDFLVLSQNDDGSFGNNDRSRDVGVCSLAGMAFLSSGSTPKRGPFGKHIEQCVDYLLANCDESGFIASASTKPMYGHGFATLFLAEVYGMARNKMLRTSLSKAVKLIIATQNQNGGWRYQPQRKDADLSVTVCQVMALRAARNAGIHVPKQTIDRCLQFVRRCQNQDGGYMYQLTGGPSTFARSAAALVAFYSAGIYEDPDLQRGLEYVSKTVTTFSDREQDNYFYYGHYYATQAMWQAGGDYWIAWFPTIRDELIRRQTRSGSWETPVWCNEYATAMATIVLQIPNCTLPIFKR